MSHDNVTPMMAGQGALPPSAVRHLEMTEDEFLDRFHPLPNHLSDTAGFDFGEGGCLFEASGPELAFVRAQPSARVWTVVDGDDGMEITEGMHVVNRIGYLVTDRCCPPDTFISVSLDG
jgi:hypothetical protein